jgi:hypothetical protein
MDILGHFTYTNSITVQDDRDAVVCYCSDNVHVFNMARTRTLPPVGGEGAGNG